MTTEPRNPSRKAELKDLVPLVDLARQMLGAARHAFNRHSQAELGNIASLHREFTLAIDPFFQQREGTRNRRSAVPEPAGPTLEAILAHLEFMAHKIAGLADPIRQKGNRGAILSERDFFAINNLFARFTGLLRALVDLLQTADPSLKAYILTESRQMREDCFREEVEHETRMMDSPGQPAAWSVYVAILEHFRAGLDHLIKLVEALD